MMLAEERAALFQARALLSVANKAVGLAGSQQALNRSVKTCCENLSLMAWQLECSIADLLADDAAPKDRSS